LASLGIYGVVSYSVAQRTNEIGIRMALGATRSNVRRLILRESLRPVLIGLVTGLFVSLVFGKLLSGLLFGVRATDPLTFASVSTIVIIVAIAASYLPAVRATRVDPLVALRYE